METPIPFPDAPPALLPVLELAVLLQIHIQNDFTDEDSYYRFKSALMKRRNNLNPETFAYFNSFTE